ncbi:DUF2927 domain-containing protein [Ferrovibrio sp.]|uniref:DUF2927 domain-containing protein n=1 Tax=Ferrovibrio sp. TaxID=1917215 RepID=UPI00261F66FC|nr:DUF2927 domain-containing protein [Ferrovibrio sp.]
MKPGWLCHRAALAGIALACIALLSACLGRDWKPPLQSHDQLVRAFDEAALARGFVMKWTEPIRYAADGRTDDAARLAFAEATLLRMAAIAGVEAYKVPHVSAANFALVFSNVENFKLASGQTAFCYAVPLADRNGHMTKVILHLNINMPNAFYGQMQTLSPEQCIVHEMMHGFGFYGHPHTTYSILSYGNIRLQDMTEADELLLRTLYDGRMKPGLQRWPALHQAHEIMAELRHEAYPDQPRPGFPAYIEKLAARLKQH